VPFNKKSRSSTLNGISAGGKGDGVAHGRAEGVAGGIAEGMAGGSTSKEGLRDCDMAITKIWCFR
jgi:hypothetical protein